MRREGPSLTDRAAAPALQARAGLAILAAMRIPDRLLATLLYAFSAAAIASPHAAVDVPPTGAETTAALAERIDAWIAQPRFSAADWGIAVVSLDSGRTLYAHNAGRLFLPASTAKLYTAALALDTVGGDYRIPTRLLGGGSIRQGRLDGPLVLYGMGDPSLGTGASADWADQLAAQLAARGVRRVRGDLVADDGYFVGPATGSGWEADDLQSWFAAPTSALSVDENTVAVTVRPAARAGQPARLSFEPDEAAPPVAGTLLTGAAHTPADINLYRAPGDATVHAFGRLPAGMVPPRYRLAVADPAALAGKLLQHALARHGIGLAGHLRVLHWPQDDTALLAHAQVLGQVLSPPLIDVLTSGLKRSQNLYLENILQIAGVKARADAAASDSLPDGFLSNEDWGIRALHVLLGRIGIPPGAALLQEGTGLSRQDLTTPAALVRLLQYLAAQPYAARLRDALPVAGKDGTLQWRMRGTPAEGNVHAKTGSMTYVACLAGYLTTAAGERLAFAIMLNQYHRAAGAAPASRELDPIAEQLAAFRGDDGQAATAHSRAPAATTPAAAKARSAVLAR